jgi:hypothetical protein
MIDPTNPLAPAAPAPSPAAQEPAQGTPAATVAQPLAPAVAAPQKPAEAPAKPAYVNPYLRRAPAPALIAPVAPVAPVAPAAPVAAAAVPVSDPRVDALMGVLGETVAQDLASLPANVAAAAKAIGGDDPVAIRKAINALRANGIASATVAMPANSAATSAAPAPAASAQSDAAVLATYNKLQRAAPIQAAAYRQQHSEAIARASRSLAS